MAITKITFAELRPCCVYLGKRKYANGLFHCWCNETTDVKGLIELEDGTVHRLDLRDIEFLDSNGKFKEYDFRKKGEE